MPTFKKKPRVPLESSIEDKFVQKLKEAAEAWGISLKTRKMNGLGYAGWPDRLVIGPQKFSCWIEFKRPGKESNVSDGQKSMFDEMEKLGHFVYVTNSATLAIAFVQESLIEHGVRLRR